MASAPRASPPVWSVLALWLAAGVLAPGAAAGLDEAEAHYEEGDMAGAAALGRALDSAAGFALAAEATLVQGAYLSPAAHKEALFERAAADAQAALARDPGHVDAHLQLALALGHLAELEDPISAHVNGYAKEGKILIDRALALDPDNAWARALLGMWHLRVVARAGDALAKSLYGATREAGVELCAKAMAERNRALALKSGCALALVKLDRDQFARTAAQALAAVKDADAQDAADRLVQKEAERLLARLKSDRLQ